MVKFVATSEKLLCNMFETRSVSEECFKNAAWYNVAHDDHCFLTKIAMPIQGHMATTFGSVDEDQVIYLHTCRHQCKCSWCWKLFYRTVTFVCSKDCIRKCSNVLQYFKHIGNALVVMIVEDFGVLGMVLRALGVRSCKIGQIFLAALA